MKNAKIDISKKIATAVICISMALAVFAGLSFRISAHGREISLVYAGCNEAGDTGSVLDAADGTPADGSRVRVYLANFSNEREEPYSEPATLRPGTTDTVGALGVTGGYQVDVYHQQWRTLSEDTTKADVVIVVDQQNGGGEGYTISWKSIIPAGTAGGAIYLDAQYALQKIPTPAIGTGKITWGAISDPAGNVYGYRVYESATEAGTYTVKGNVTSAPWEFSSVVGNYWYKLSVLYRGAASDGSPTADGTQASPGTWTDAGAVESQFKGPAVQCTVAPAVTTNTATGVSTTTATLNMDYTIGTYSSVQVRFDYKKTADTAWSSTSWETKTSSGSHSESLIGLSSSTEYQFKAVLKYDTTQIEGSILTFTTTTLVAPTATTNAATSITATGATLNMDYTIGTYSSVQVRFDYKKTADTAWSSTSWATKTSSGSHSESLTSLSSGAEYQFNATLKYDSTTIYGEVLTFNTTTITAPTVTTTAASSVSTTTATLNMNYTIGTYSSVQVRFDYKKTADTAWTSTSWVTKTASGSHSGSLTGLSPGTQYQFNATLKYDSSIIHGGVLTFTTTTTVPIVTTTAASSVGTTTATLNMDYTIGTYASVQIRFDYKKTADTAWTSTSWVTKTAAGSYSESLTGLSPNTEYQFNATLKYDTTVLFGTALQFTTTAPDTTAPAAPTGLTATSGNEVVDLSWNANTESDLAGYNVYRSTTSGSGYAKINTDLVTGTLYHDTGLTNGDTYYYVITSVDSAGNPSGYSNEVSAKPEKPAEGGKPGFIPSVGIVGTSLALLGAALIIYKKRRK